MITTFFIIFLLKYIFDYKYFKHIMLLKKKFLYDQKLKISSKCKVEFKRTAFCKSQAITHKFKSF
jgi:hypothetical protein